MLAWIGPKPCTRGTVTSPSRTRSSARPPQPPVPPGLGVEHRPRVGESLPLEVPPAAVDTRSADPHGPAGMGLLRSILSTRCSPHRNVDRRRARCERGRAIRATRVVRDGRMRHARGPVRRDLSRSSRRADLGRSLVTLTSTDDVPGSNTLDEWENFFQRVREKFPQPM
jgi:hypothetical protein